ncbi:hypothetical protein ACS0TY_035136 [Phlomoides rotata]
MSQENRLNHPKMKQELFKRLPSEIVIDILSRLSVRTVISCKCVQKSWLHLVETQEFVKSHLSKSVPGLALTIFELSLNSNSYNFFEFEDGFDVEHHDLHYKLVTKFNLTNDETIMGSADGSWRRHASCGLLEYIGISTGAFNILAPCLFLFPGMENHGGLNSIAYPIKVFKDGDVLMQCNGFFLYYSSKTKTTQKVDIFDQPNTYHINPILHIPSFISLKSFGLDLANGIFPVTFWALPSCVGVGNWGGVSRWSRHAEGEDNDLVEEKRGQCGWVCGVGVAVEFVKLHLSKSIPGLIIVETIIRNGEDAIFLNLNLNFFEFEDGFDVEHHDLHYKLVTKFDVTDLGWIIGSAGGLLLISKLVAEPIALSICNPITRDYINLPCPQVFDIDTDFDDETLSVLYTLLGQDFGEGLHLVPRSEHFSTLSAPPFPWNGENRNLGAVKLFALGDCLGLCDSTSDDEIVIWSMKEHGVEKPWIQEYVMTNVFERGGSVCPIKVFKDGDILMICVFYMFHYSSKTKTTRKVDMFKQPNGNEVAAILHTPSFLPLKSFGLNVSTF